MIDELRMTIFEVANKSSLEGGGLRSVSAAGRRVFDLALKRFVTLFRTLSRHLSLRQLAEYSPQGEIDKGVQKRSSLEGGELRSVSAAGRWVLGVGISNTEQGMTNDEVRANHD